MPAANVRALVPRMLLPPKRRDVGRAFALASYSCAAMNDYNPPKIGRTAWISSCRRARNGWRRKLQAFFDRDVLPRHRALSRHTVANGEAAPVHGRASSQGARGRLWNLGLPELAPDEPGTRLSNLEYAPLAEIMGRLFWAPEAFNCQAPDVPNMIALQNCATAAQKKRWLDPLLECEDALGLRHDRAGRGIVGCDQHRDQDRPRRRRLRDQRAANGSSPAPRIRIAAS